MREPVRAYLMAGLSTVAVGAIIAAPMSPLSPHIASPQPQVRTNDVQLAALSTPLTPGKFADQSAAVHVLAEVSRGLESIKAANAASGRAHPLLASATPARAQVQTGVVTAQDPLPTPTPATDNHRSSTAPRRAAVNAIDPPAITNVLAQATQLALDVSIGEPARLVEGTVFSLDAFIIDVGTLDPDTISSAFQDFIDSESEVINSVHADLSFDVNGLQDAVGHLFGVDDRATVPSAKTTTPSTTAGAAESGTAESDGAAGAAPTKPRGHVVDTGSKGHIVAGKGAQDESTSSAQDPNTAGTKGGTATTANPSDGKASGSSNSQSTGAQADDASDTKSGNVSDSKHTTAKSATPSKMKVSDNKPGDTSGPGHNTKNPSHTTKKADHNGGQSTGNTSKSDGKHSKHGA
jgi:hypothetical protein